MLIQPRIHQVTANNHQIYYQIPGFFPLFKQVLGALDEDNNRWDSAGTVFWCMDPQQAPPRIIYPRRVSEHFIKRSFDSARPYRLNQRLFQSSEGRTPYLKPAPLLRPLNLGLLLLGFFSQKPPRAAVWMSLLHPQTGWRPHHDFL